MSRNNFHENYDFGVRHYRYLLDVLYRSYCYDGRYVHIDHSPFSTYIQQGLKTDTVIQKEAQVSYGIEEKVVSWPEEKGKPHTAFFLETRSCTNPGHESPGWMEDCQADKLLYAFEIKDLGLVVYLLDFSHLKRWFWQQYLPQISHPDYGRVVMADENRTEGWVVEIATVVNHTPTECFLLTFDGVCRRLKPNVAIERLREAYAQGKNTSQSSRSSLREAKHENEKEKECPSSDGIEQA